MLIENSADIIARIEPYQKQGHYAEMLHFHDGRVLVISRNAIALYKNADSVHDPLGNGLLHLAEIPTDSHLEEKAAPWVLSHSAGFVGLYDDKALLILPVAIRLYDNKQDALQNQNPLLELPLKSS